MNAKLSDDPTHLADELRQIRLQIRNLQSQVKQEETQEEVLKSKLQKVCPHTEKVNRDFLFESN